MAISFELVPEELGLRNPAFLGAFLNWPDASMGASGAVRYLVESLRAAPLATWDGDDYYDFVELRPISRVVPPRDRTLIWPDGEFWVARNVPLAANRGSAAGEEESDHRSLIFFLAHEPRLRWRAYSRELASLIKRCGVTQAIFFGAAYADVPHTRPPIVTAWATDSRLRTKLEALDVPFSAYQGPSSMQSAAIEACRAVDIACVSLFSNAPHYLPVPNANLSHALLRRAASILGIQVDLAPLEEAGQALVQQANAAMDERTEFRDHVRQLEAQFDAQAAPLAPGEVRRGAERRAQAEAERGPLNVDPQDIVRELEEFLRRRTQSQPGAEGEGDNTGEGDGGPPEGGRPAP
ncbi:MAG: PAC2 family protein [Chloroflexi bacterium]|nr:PAC2 family protein [Chloroflexota bacterium]